jgi:hypothetical protein
MDSAVDDSALAAFKMIMVYALHGILKNAEELFSEISLSYTNFRQPESTI